MTKPGPLPERRLLGVRLFGCKPVYQDKTPPKKTQAGGVRRTTQGTVPMGSLCFPQRGGGGTRVFS